MRMMRWLMIMLACLLPWQSVQAGVSTLPVALEATSMLVEVPCHASATAPCCDDSCAQMTVCFSGGAVCPPAIITLRRGESAAPPVVFRLRLPASVLGVRLLRPPISRA